VLGGIDARSIDALERLYESFPGVPRVRTNTRTAEMIKYASNSLLALLISFSNEIGNLCTATGGIDAVDVMRGVHLSQYFRGRTSDGLPPITSFLKVGCGFGGSCLPKDVKALIASGRRAGASTSLLEATIQVNDGQPMKVIDLLRRHWSDLSGRRVAVLGLSFKPETSDVRESPAFPIMRGLLDAGAAVAAYDPVATKEAQQAFPDARVDYCDTLDRALAGIAAAVVVTPWKEFRDVPQRLKGRTPAVVFVDSRRAFDRHEIEQYEGIGA
jgi:UDPglucose 6-dehydrogenase/GDP-mannose 6-dehydrogenase